MVNIEVSAEVSLVFMRVNILYSKPSAKKYIAFLQWVNMDQSFYFNLIDMFLLQQEIKKKWQY